VGIQPPRGYIKVVTMNKSDYEEALDELRKCMDMVLEALETDVNLDTLDWPRISAAQRKIAEFYSVAQPSREMLFRQRMNPEFEVFGSQSDADHQA